MAVKPTNLAEWATGGGAPIAEPLLAEKQAGWAVAFKPPAQWFNWWQKLVHQWVVWLDAFESDPHTWSALQSFNNATFSGPLTTNSAFAANGTATFSGASAFNDTISLNPTGFTAAMALATVAAGRKLLLRVPVSGTVAMRIYASPETGGAAGGFGAGLEFVYNAEWNGSVWTRDDVTKQAGRVVIGQGIQVSQPGTGAAWSPQVMFGGYDAALFPAGVNSGYTEFDMLVFNPSGQLVVAAEQTQRAWDNLTLSANMTPTVLTPRLFLHQRHGASLGLGDHQHHGRGGCADRHHLRATTTRPRDLLLRACPHRFVGPCGPVHHQNHHGRHHLDRSNFADLWG